MEGRSGSWMSALGFRTSLYVMHMSSFQVDWSELRFSEIVQKLKAFLKQAGFKVSQLTTSEDVANLHISI